MQDFNLPHNHGQEIQHVLSHLPSSEDFTAISQLFHLLGDSTRLKIFWILCHCEECVINLSAAMNMSSPAISHHLRQLKTSGLITGRRDGKEVYYKAADTPLVKELHNILESVSAISCPTFENA